MKLTLNKETIATLSNEEANRIKGGTQGTRVSCQSNTLCFCPPPENTCLTCPHYSSNKPTQLQDAINQCMNCGV